MTRNYFQKANLSLKDKIFAFDFTLFFLILLLGIISLFAMYSSERGNFSYHTKIIYIDLVFSFCFLLSFLFLEFSFGINLLIYFIL